MSGDKHEIIIESGIPVPPSYDKEKTKELIDAIEKMEINQSFLVKTQILGNSVRCIARRRGIKIRTKTTSKGIRIWRIS